MKQYLIILSLILLGLHAFAKEDKAAQKNNKIVEKEEQRYQKDLRKNTDSAGLYLRHANAIAAINSEAARASGFYLLALKYDSTNAAAYRDYGKYLADRLRKYNDSKAMLDRAHALAPADEDVKNYLTTVNKIIAAQDEDNRMRDFGTTTLRELDSVHNYAAITKFDSLKILIATPGNPFYYDALLSRFLADDPTLTPAEMYMMIVGYAKQPTYNPFNYNDILGMRMIANHNLDTAIKTGIALTHTNPLNPTLNRELMYYYRKKNEPALADKYLHRIAQYFNGMLYSGNGTCARPYVSLWAKEEYNFITYLGYQATDVHSMGTCAGQMAEVIDRIDPATHKTEPVHFNVALIYMQATGK